MAKLNGTEWDEGEWQRQHGAELERLKAEVARLREALRLIYIRADVEANEPIYELAEAALSTPAADWLAQHDRQVRQGERESCCDVIRAACQPCGGTGGMEHPDGEASECPYCGYPIAAIREDDDD